MQLEIGFQKIRYYVQTYMGVTKDL